MPILDLLDHAQNGGATIFHPAGCEKETVLVEEDDVMLLRSPAVAFAR